ncbi:MAG: glycosyltransferase family 1 protein, partial [Bacteroidaceae bacterium]|nr:glycosyltransferase family 1 protein [Bacteroidaceae bacterium]
MEKKTVLLDISDIGNPTSGFGQIAKNYAQWYSGMKDDALRFHFLLPPGYAGDFGPLVETTNIRRKYHKFFRKGLPSV